MPHRIDRQSPAFAFHRTLLRLTEGQRFLLQVINDLRSVSEVDLSRYFYSGRSQKLHKSLKTLEMYDLAFPRADRWLPTWTGDGTANWRQQLLGADSPDLNAIPMPRPGENGQLLGPPCQEYRSAFFAPGHCWCCRHRSDHFDEVLKAAENLLRPRGNGH